LSCASFESVVRASWGRGTERERPSDRELVWLPRHTHI
jgi:hypothetical protein